MARCRLVSLSTVEFPLLLLMETLSSVPKGTKLWHHTPVMQVIQTDNFFLWIIFIYFTLGYELVGDDTSTCGADEKWTSIGTCSRIHCAEVNSVVDASVTPKLLSTDTNENEVYTTVNFSCTSNYYVSGSKSMTCQEDGIWSAIAPSCIIKECPLLSDLDNGYIKMNQRDLEIGASVEYVCNTGYQLNSTRSRYLRYCNRDVDLEDAGSWDGEHVACLGVPCDTLPIQESIVFTPEDMVAAHRFGAFVPYNCSDGYVGPMGFFQCGGLIITSISNFLSYYWVL